MFLDDWQAWCLDQMLSEDATGRWCAWIICLLLPRQNGKNSILEALELYAFYVLDERRIIHSAHLTKTAADHHKRMKLLVRGNPELEDLTHFRDSNGKEALERKDTGATLEFMTRSQRTIRGGSPQRIVFDEALFLTDLTLQAMIPSLAAQSMNVDGAPQFIYTSSAPLAHSEVLLRVRERGMSADPGKMFFASWESPVGTRPDDVEAWYEDNPGLGIRISEEWIRETELPPALTEEAFLIERLGVVFDYTEVQNPAFPNGEWLAALDKDSNVAGGRVAIAWDLSPDSKSGAVAFAGQRPDGRWHVEVVDARDGTDWVTDRVVEAVVNAGARCAALGVWSSSTAAALIPNIEAGLKAAGVTLATKKDPGLPMVAITSTDYAASCGQLFTAVVDDRLRHKGQHWLDTAVANAERKPRGEAWVWDRKKWSTDITSLCAVTVAMRAFTDAPEPVKKNPVFAA